MKKATSEDHSRGGKELWQRQLGVLAERLGRKVIIIDVTGVKG